MSQSKGEESSGQPRRDRLARIYEQSAQVKKTSADLSNRSAEALRYLPPAQGASALGSAPHEQPNPAHSEQLQRQHVFMVNSDPVFLDAARVLLQAERYNVTATNLVSTTFEMILVGAADALIIDLQIGETEIWPLVEQVASDQRTRMLPVIFTAANSSLMERAEESQWPQGGRFFFLKPFTAEDLPDVIHSLIGPASWND